VREHEPGLIVTPPLRWIDLTLDDYLPLYYPVPARTLYVRRSVFAERFPVLSRHWMAREAYHPDDAELVHHPLRWNFERGVDSGWVTGGPINEFVGQPRQVQFARRPVTEDYLNTAGRRDLWATLSSPPFMIDFDEISFRFGGTDRFYTRARFIVDGQVVLEQRGEGKRPLQMRDVYWPVWSWKGKAGVLQFDDADTNDGFLAADHVQTSRYERFSLADDFETDGGYGTFWESGFGAGPSDLEPLARERGLAMLLGRRAALSRGDGVTGPVEMRSRPFVVERDGLSFQAFDFGGEKTRIELRVGGEVKRSWWGGKTERLQGVVWGVKALRGEEAVLAIVDEEPGDIDWIGLDDVATFDRGGSESASGD
jgi:hypothetical protein